MITIQTRLSPSTSDVSRRSRKYSTPLIWEALSLAKEIGTTKAAKATGIPYRRLVRLICADRRSHMTMREALGDLDWYTANRQGMSPDHRRELATMLKNDLIMKIEVAGEAYRVATRTGGNFWRALKGVARQRGMNGKSICELVREGRLPRHWFDGSHPLQQQQPNHNIT